MEDRIDKKLDELTTKLLKDFSPESPSFDFTSQVMSKLETSAKAAKFEYKPIISKKLWYVLAALIAAVFAYLIFGDVDTENASMVSSTIDNLLKQSSYSLPSYQVSNILLYGIIGFTFCISIQMMVLKNHFDKRYA